MKVRVLLNGAKVRHYWELEPQHRGLARRHKRAARLARRWRPRAGILFGGAAAATFVPIISIRTSSATETIPSGATTLSYEFWGNGGGGGGTTGAGCAAVQGGGGGGGSRSTGGFTVLTQNGKTFTCTVGAVGTAGVANGASGGSAGTNTVNAGTVTGWNNYNSNAATGGTTGGAAGTGVTPTNTNSGATNTTGNNGSGRNGGASLPGFISGDGSGSYGTGGAGHISGSVGNGNPGILGALVFSYT